MTTPSTFMQFGTEAQIAAKDVGQPKFRLVERDGQVEPLYVLLGSLHMPQETPDDIAAVETYVNSEFMQTMLTRIMRLTSGRALDPEAHFEYVPRGASHCHTDPEYARTAFQ